MMPSLPAFADELALIKMSADEKAKKEFKSELPAMVKSRFKSSLKYGLGAGLGYGTGWLIGEATRPWLLKNMTPTKRKLLSGAIAGLGSLGALATWDAMRTAAKAEEDAVKDAAK